MWRLLKKLFFSKGTPAAAPNHRKILVIDDGQVERSFMTQTLTHAGYTVIARPDGISGFVSAVEQQPDLVILDYLMPEMDGKAVCRKIKTTPQTKHIPVIFLTGSSRPETVITCYDVGADQYLSKPISAKALLAQVRVTLDESLASGQKIVDNPADADKI